MLSYSDDLILPPTLPNTNADFDFDTMLAAVSPIHHNDLNLSSSHPSLSPSASSSTISLSQDIDFDIDMASQVDEESARRLMFPLATQGYLSQMQTSPSQQMPYNTQHAPLAGTQTWMSLPLFSQQQNIYDSAPPPNSLYSSFENNLVGGTVIPPTPQNDNTPSFFNAAPSRPQDGYLVTTSSHATSYSSHESNGTSLSSSVSRSCSPSPNLCTSLATPTFSYTSRLASTPQTTQLSLSTSAPTELQSQAQASSNSLHAYGIPVPTTSPSQPQTWRCAYPNCSSRALFTRGCDLRKHYNRHSKHLFCRVQGCPQSAPRLVDPSNARLGASGVSGVLGGLTGGFSSKKDRARHEAKHNPRILCEWVGEDGERCGRRFSRMDNMKDHMRRIHRKGQAERGEKAAEGEGRGGRKQKGGESAD